MSVAGRYTNSEMYAKKILEGIHFCYCWSFARDSSAFSFFASARSFMSAMPINTAIKPTSTAITGNPKDGAKTPAPHPPHTAAVTRKQKPPWGTNRSKPAQTRATIKTGELRRLHCGFEKFYSGKQTEQTLCIVGSLKNYQPSCYINLNFNITA